MKTTRKFVLILEDEYREVVHGELLTGESESDRPVWPLKIHTSINNIYNELREKKKTFIAGE